MAEYAVRIAQDLQGNLVYKALALKAMPFRLCLSLDLDVFIRTVYPWVS